MSNDLLSILISTDNHLGFKEKDLIRREDSFVAIEEVLQTALQHDIDFIILGGDLFHQHYPSKESLNKALQLFKNYTLGEKTHNFQVTESPFPLNILDPSIRVRLPVFIIHGNHDNPHSNRMSQQLP